MNSLLNLLFIFVFIIKEIYSQYCYINSNIPNYCKTCKYTYYNLDFNYTFPNKEFLSASCKKANATKYTENIYIDNSIKDCTLCNGTLTNPYNNIGKAFLITWGKLFKNQEALLNFYLIGKDHYINKDDIFGLDNLQLYRRLFIEMKITPLYCNTTNINGCYNLSDPLKEIKKPRIFLKTNALHIFISNKLILINIIFDGSDLHISNFTDQRYNMINVCSFNLINKTYDDKSEDLYDKCALRNRIVARYPDDYGLFVLEWILSDSVHDSAMRPTLNVHLCEFLLINYGYPTIISSFLWSSYILFQNSKIYYNYIPGGIFSTKTYDNFYSPTYNDSFQLTGYLVLTDYTNYFTIVLNYTDVFENNYFNITETNYLTQAIALFYLESYSYRLFLFNSNFKNNKNYKQDLVLNTGSSLFKFLQATNTYKKTSYLDIENCLFINNTFPYQIWFTPNVTSSTYLNLTLINNIFIGGILQFSYIEQPSYNYLKNNRFINIPHLFRFLEFQYSGHTIYFYNMSFINVNCPFPNPLLLNDTKALPVIFKLNTNYVTENDFIFQQGSTSSSYSEDDINIENSLFSNFNCSLYLQENEPVYQTSFYNTIFSNIYISSTEYFIFLVNENNFVVSGCIFYNIKAKIILYEKHGRKIIFENSNFTKIDSTIFKTSLYVPKSNNLIKMSITNCNFSEIRSFSNIIDQDGMFITSGYVTNIINCNFRNFSNNNERDINGNRIIISGLSLVNENINITNVNFEFFEGVQIIKIAALLMKASTSKIIIINNTFNNNESQSPSTFMEVLFFDEILLVFSNFIGSDQIVEEKTIIDIETGDARIEIIHCNFLNLNGRYSVFLLVSNNIFNFLIYKCDFSKIKCLNFGSIIVTFLKKNDYLSNIVKNGFFSGVRKTSLYFDYCENKNNFSYYACTIRIRNVTYRYEMFKLMGIIESNFNKCFGYLGGCIQMTENSQLYLSKIIFSESNAEYGGVIAAKKLSELYLFDIIIMMSSSNSRGGGIDLKQTNLTMNRSLIINSKAYYGGFISGVLSNIYLVNIDIYDTFASSKGGTFYLFDGSIIIRNTFVNNSNGTYLGGSIFMMKGSLIIDNSLFSDCFSFIEGGVFFLEFISFLEMTNFSIVNSKADKNGVIYVSSINNFSFLISNFIIEYNSGQYSSFHIRDSSIKFSKGIFRNLESRISCISAESLFNKGNIILEQCQFYYIYSNQYLLEALGFQIKINFCLFHGLEYTYYHINKIITSNLTIYKSYYQISLLNSYTESQIYNFFYYLEDSYFRAISVGFGGIAYISGFYGNNMNGVNFSNCYFLELKSSNYPSFFYLTKSKYFILSNCLFFKLTSDSEAVIHIEDTIFNGENNYFIENFVKFDSVSTIYSTNTNNQSKINLNNNTFINNNYKCIYLNQLINVTLTNINVNNTNISNLNTQFIYFNNVNYIIVKNSFFEYFKNMSVFEIYAYSFISKIIFYNNTIKNSFSVVSGGGFHIVGNINMYIINSIFNNLTSTDDGGVMMINCEPMFSFLLIENSSFLNNTSFKSGGLIKFFDNPKFFLNRENFYLNNKGFTSDLFASIPNKLYIYNRIIESDIVSFLKEENSKIFESFNNNKAFLFENFRSGDNLRFSVVVFDYFRNFQEFESDSFLELTFNLGSNVQNSSLLQIYNGKANVINGIANFKNLQIVGVPGDTYLLNITSYQMMISSQFSQILRISLRLCIRGEEFLGSQCNICKRKYYSLHIYSSNDKSDSYFCNICENNADCFGYDSIIPRFGYWRFNENSTLIVKCIVPESCPEQVQMTSLGTEEYYKNFVFKYICGPGYEGNICANCIEGYGKNSDNECVLCSTSIWLYIKFWLFSLIMICFMILQAHTALSFQENESKKRSFLKIIVDHMSFVSFIYRFNVDWAGAISEYFVVSDKYVNTTPQEIFNFNCFLTLIFNTKEATFYINSILVSFSPIFFGIVTLFVWYIIQAILFIIDERKRRKNRDLKSSLDHLERENIFSFRKFKKNCMALFLVLYYNFYPRLILNGFLLFKCVNLNNQTEKYLSENPDLECWVGQHLLLIFSLALPNLIIWGIFIPIIISLLAFRMTAMMKLTMKYQYWKDILNYLTIDYEENKYYWEAFLYLQKFLVVGFSISSNNLDAASQGGLMIMLFLFFFLIYEYFRPSKYLEVNKYRIYSYMTTICTSGFAILSANSEISNEIKLLYISCLLFINIIFYVGWGVIFIKIQLNSYKTLAKKIAKSFNNVFSKENLAKKSRGKITTISNKE